jgi:hypothetical protein
MIGERTGGRKALLTRLSVGSAQGLAGIGQRQSPGRHLGDDGESSCGITALAPACVAGGEEAAIRIEGQAVH